MYAMSRYPRHQYQPTTTSNNTHAHHHHQLQVQLQQPPGLAGPHLHHLRHPWSGGPPPCESQSTNSSSSSRTHRGLGGGGGGAGPPWPPPHSHPHTHPQAEPLMQPPPPPPPPFNHHPRGYADHAVEVMVDGPRAGTALLLHPQGPHAVGSGAAPTIVRYSTSSRDASDRDRPSSQTSSPGGHSGGGGTVVGGCGGHCVAFENFCYYCQRVIFIAGILTGISLTIAGSVLRSQQRGGDLLVLVYIGCLISLVCTLLLAVQCCVRRNVKRRKRTLRCQRERLGQRRVAQAAAGAATATEIPLHGLKVQAQVVANRAVGGGGGPPQQYQPLLMHIVQQQQQQTANATVAVDGGPRPPQHYHHQPYRSGNTTDTSGFVGRVVDVSRSGGAPWWRRHAELGPGVAESRH